MFQDFLYSVDFHLDWLKQTQSCSLSSNLILAAFLFEIQSFY